MKSTFSPARCQLTLRYFLTLGIFMCGFACWRTYPQAVTGCLQLTLQYKHQGGQNQLFGGFVKNGMYENYQTDPPRWQVYKQWDWTRTFDYNDTYNDGNFNENVSWQENGSYEEIFYDDGSVSGDDYGVGVGNGTVQDSATSPTLEQTINFSRTPYKYIAIPQALTTSPYFDPTYGYYYGLYDEPPYFLANMRDDWYTYTATSSTTAVASGSGPFTSGPFTANWNLSYSESYSDLYTTQEFTNYAMTTLMNEAYQTYSGNDWDTTGNYTDFEGNEQVAFAELSDDEISLDAQNALYRMQFRGESGQSYVLQWIERFEPDDGGPIQDSLITEAVLATGSIQYTKEHYVSFPSVNGIIVIVLPKVVCGSDTCQPGANASDFGSVNFSISLGDDYTGARIEDLCLDSDLPSSSLTDPASLQFDADELYSYRDQIPGQPLMIFAPEMSVDVVSNDPTFYDIQLYHPEDFSDPNVGPTGNPFTVWRVSTSDGAGATVKHLDITKTSGGPSVVNHYVWSDGNQGWTVTTGNGLRTETTVNTTVAGTSQQIQIDTIQDQSLATVYTETRTLQTYPNPMGTVLIQKTVDPNGVARTSTYQYFTDPVNDGNYYGKLQQVVNADGSWTRYAYDSNGRLTKEVSGFGNVGPSAADSSCRIKTYDYTPVDPLDDGTLDPTSPRTTIESLLGQEISRSYLAVLPGEHDEYQCVVPGAAYDDPGNLVTTTTTYTQGDSRILGKTYVVNASDGTREVNTYSFDDANNQVTHTILQGQPDPGNSANVNDGTRTVIVTTQPGRAVSTNSYDIVTGRQLSSDVGSNFDSFNRPQTITHLDGTQTDTTYDCCGVDSITERDGTLTTYEYDALNRQTAEHHFVGAGAITLKTTYDPLGNVLSTSRIGSDGSSTITLSSSTYNLAGELTSMKNAMNQTTTYSLTFDGSGQAVHTTTYPDSGTRVETYFVDGLLQSVTGSAVFPARYEYGVEGDGGSARAYAKEIKLNGLGDTSEWTKIYTDVGNRKYKTVYASGTGSPASISSFNNLGQLTKQVDPDLVTTLYQYNGKGELQYSAVDMNRNGSIDFGGTDRITETVSDVVSDNGDVRRTRKFVWGTDGANSSTLISTSETSTDGLRSWNTVWNNGVAATTSSQTAYNALAETMTVRTTAPDNSYSVSTFQYGQLVSTTRYDSANNQVSGVSYGYDIYGRQITATDARNGATTYTYNNADQVSTVTTPSPDGVRAGQFTQYFFDSMGRITTITLPDNTSVGNLYLKNGLLQQASGSRTYPVAYTYDYAGRMKTMKTWKNFSGNSGAAVTTWNYDPYRGWLTSKTYDGGIAGPNYTYTDAGRLLTRAWARPVTTTYGYDYAGDLQSATYSDSTAGVVNGFDRRGRKTTVTSGATTCTLTYNDAGELLSESYSGGPLDGLTVAEGYDNLLRRTSLSLNNQSSTLSSATYGYDAASRLQSVSDGINSAIYSYLANSPIVSQIQFKNSGTLRATTTKSYDYLNRLTSIQSSAGASTINSFSYIYNNANQRTSATDADGSYWVYQYDSLGQVTSGDKYWSDDTPVAGQQFNYIFDTIGNREFASSGGDENGGGLWPANYSANNLNQLTSRNVPPVVHILGEAASAATVTVNGQTPYRRNDYFREELTVNNGLSPVWVSVTNVAIEYNANSANLEATNLGNVFVPKTSQSFTYDSDGNLTGNGRWTYTWDAENRLITMVSATPVGPLQSIAFGYDWMGRRVSKTVWNNTAGTGTPALDERFAYDGWNLIATLNPQFSILQSFMWGSDLSGSIQGAGGIGGLLTANFYGAATTNCFATFDGNGNVAALVNAADGTTRADYEYGPFGEAIRATEPLAKANPLRFSTKSQDDETDLIYYGRRYYNASIGRWLGRDPVEESGGNNLYNFVGNNPLIQSDPYGLNWSDLVGAAKSVVSGYNALNEPADWVAGQIDNGWNFVLDQATPRLNQDQYPYTYMGAQDAREISLAALLVVAGDISGDFEDLPEEPPKSLSKPAKICPTKADLKKAFPRKTPWRKGVREAVFNRAKRADGKVYDEYTGVEIKYEDPWEFGHKPGYKFSDWQQQAWDEGWSREDWNDFLNDPDTYVPETRFTNEGHYNEDPWY